MLFVLSEDPTSFAQIVKINNRLSDLSYGNQQIEEFTETVVNTFFNNIITDKNTSEELLIKFIVEILKVFINFDWFIFLFIFLLA